MAPLPFFYKGPDLSPTDPRWRSPMFPKFHLVHPARLFALIEAVIAAVAAFLPMSGPQVAALCAVAAVITGEGVKRRVPAG